ncbi:MAG: S41 family peptidase [Clostridia bacterium]|nr:S41 family peptidase [Clostridia bacterium]
MFKKKISPFTCVVLCVIVCAVTFVAVYSRTLIAEKEKLNSERLDSAQYGKYSELIDSVGDDAAKHEKLAKMFDMIESTYVRPSDDNKLWETLFKTLAESLGDDYSVYLTSDEYNAMIDSGDGNFVGIGVHAVYDPDTHGIYLFGIIPNSPAEKAGLKTGDVISAVDGVYSTEESYYDVLDLIRGESGTDVALTVLRNGESLEISVTRAPVLSHNVIYEPLADGIAYIRILSFADFSVSEEFDAAIAKAQGDGCERFIFDVRNNGGGYLDEICAVLDKLLPEGPIINIVDKDGKTTTKDSDAECINAPMAVLCNGGTASAAELFTAALRDYELAEIIGEKTFGKGTMQITQQLPDGSALKLSSAFYNPPSNVSYDGIGIIPDCEIKLDEEWQNRFYKMPKENDTQLQKAIEVIKGN